MRNDNLLKKVSALGFPLLAPEEVQNANLTLADMVKSKDLRLWEGFPVVLAYSAEKGLFDYNKTEDFLKNAFDRLHMGSLVALSLALYHNLGLKFSWMKGLYKLLNSNGKRAYDGYLKALRTSEDLYVQSKLMSSERLKDTFRNYFNHQETNLKELLYAREELELEYALSQVFSPKQRELFLKKLKNEKLTKTEKEYFSRVVKKKVLALANPELHRLSQKLLE